jgi:uncharacterized protein (DUF4415 family)
MKNKNAPNPDKPLTDKEFKSMKTVRGVDGLASILGEDFVAPMRKRGRPVQPQTKEQVTIRLDADIMKKLRKSGRGWQTRINDILRESLA